MKIVYFLTIKLIAITFLLSAVPADSYAGGGHAHFGRSEFVNGGMSPDQMSQSLADIHAKTTYAKELLRTGDLDQLKDVALSIHDISSWVAENASMNRARHTNLKRASKSISKAADKLGQYALDGDAPSAQRQIERIDKFLELTR